MALLQLAVFIASVMFTLISIIVLRRVVLSRILSLDKTVSDIVETGDRSIRVAFSGKDEISRLTAYINTMLNELELANRKITALYEQEKKQREELEEEIRARAQFIHVIAHELRTPLTPLMVSVDLVHEILSKEPDSVQYRLIRSASGSIIALRNRLEELLDLARYTRGMFKLNIQSLDTGRFLETIVLRYKPALDQKQQALVIDIQPDLPALKADASCLEQVIVNLLSNAGKYSSENTTITFRAARDKGSLLIEVRDQGIGIQPEDQKNLFMPYHRAQQDRQSYPGIGLGLAVCSQIIQAHGGKIWVDSERGNGSSFKFTIPFDQDGSTSVL